MTADASNFIRRLAEHRRRVLAEAVAAAEAGADRVLADAQGLCPGQTGELRASGRREEAQVNGTQVSVAIGFDAPYAAIVHEDLEAHHDNGQAKYLETAQRNDADQVMQGLARRIGGIQ